MMTLRTSPWRERKCSSSSTIKSSSRKISYSSWTHGGSGSYKTAEERARCVLINLKLKQKLGHDACSPSACAASESANPGAGCPSTMRRPTSQEVLDVLRTLPFPQNTERVGVRPLGQDFVLSINVGLTTMRGGLPTQSQHCKKCPSVAKLLALFCPVEAGWEKGQSISISADRPADAVKSRNSIDQNKLDSSFSSTCFTYTSITVNKNYAARPHRDANHFEGKARIIALGEFGNGELWVENPSGKSFHQLHGLPGDKINIKNNWYDFDARDLHGAFDFSGRERFSLVYFTHDVFKKARPGLVSVLRDDVGLAWPAEAFPCAPGATTTLLSGSSRSSPGGNGKSPQQLRITVDGWNSNPATTTGTTAAGEAVCGSTCSTNEEKHVVHVPVVVEADTRPRDDGPTSAVIVAKASGVSQYLSFFPVAAQGLAALLRVKCEKQESMAQLSASANNKKSVQQNSWRRLSTLRHPVCVEFPNRRALETFSRRLGSFLEVWEVLDPDDGARLCLDGILETPVSRKKMTARGLIALNDDSGVVGQCLSQAQQKVVAATARRKWEVQLEGDGRDRSISIPRPPQLGVWVPAGVDATGLGFGCRLLRLCELDSSLEQPACTSVVPSGPRTRTCERTITALPPPRPPRRAAPLTKELAQLMINAARVTEGSLVLDPCAGSNMVGREVGNLLLRDVDSVGEMAAAGAVVAASRARARGCVISSDVDVDFCEPLSMIAANLFHAPFRLHGQYDAVVCDPPFGRRESVVQGGGTTPGGARLEAGRSKGRDARNSSTSSSSTPAVLGIYENRFLPELFRLALRALRLRGRLVFLYPHFPNAALNDEGAADAAGGGYGDGSDELVGGRARVRDAANGHNHAHVDEGKKQKDGERERPGRAWTVSDMEKLVLRSIEECTEREQGEVAPRRNINATSTSTFHLVGSGDQTWEKSSGHVMVRRMLVFEKQLRQKPNQRKQNKADSLSTKSSTSSTTTTSTGEEAASVPSTLMDSASTAVSDGDGAATSATPILPVASASSTSPSAGAGSDRGSARKLLCEEAPQNATGFLDLGAATPLQLEEKTAMVSVSEDNAAPDTAHNSEDDKIRVLPRLATAAAGATSNLSRIPSSPPSVEDLDCWKARTAPATATATASPALPSIPRTAARTTQERVAAQLHTARFKSLPAAKQKSCRPPTSLAPHMKCEKTLRFDRDLVAEMGQVLLAELQAAMSMSRGATSTPTTRSRRHEHDNDDSNSESGRKDEVKHDRTIKRGFLSLFGSRNEGSADRNADLLKPGAIQKLILASCPRFLKLYEKFVEDHVAVQFLHDHFLEAGREAGVTLAWRRTEPQFRTRAFSDSESSVEEGDSKKCQLQKLDDKLVAVYYQYPPTLRVKVLDTSSPCSAQHVSPVLDKHDEGNSGLFAAKPSIAIAVHTDDVYGHQDGELNFWMPLASVSVSGETSSNGDVCNTLWCESVPGKGDFKPFAPLSVGEVKRFWGSKCRHAAVALTRAAKIVKGRSSCGRSEGDEALALRNEENKKSCTEADRAHAVTHVDYPVTKVVDEEEQEVRENDVRVSLDFRCFLADNFDFGFRLAGRGVAYSHERRKATYAATVERVDRRSGQPR